MASPDPHPLYVVGPIVFVASSFVASLVATPLAMRRLRKRFGPLRRPHRVRALCLLGSVALVWLIGSCVGVALLAIPVTEREGRLPADHIDAAVVAHMIPTTSAAACDQLIRRLEDGGSGSRWEPRGEMETRLVLAARIDRDPDRAVLRLARHGFRTHAGRFAKSSPTPAACYAGLDALAEAVQGAALKDLMIACQNAPGDPVGLAAFKVGDFMLSVGPETESIISRQPRAPSGEPTCYAEGPDLPDSSMPMCRLLHAELHKRTRLGEIEGLVVRAPFAARWIAALRVEHGEALAAEAAWTIDPALLLEDPFAAVADEPVGVYEDIRQHGWGTLTPGQSGYIRLAIAAERSAMGRHADAAKLIQEAYGEMAIGSGATSVERAEAARLVVAIALRAGDGETVDARSAELSDDDPVKRWVDWLGGDAPAADGDPDWADGVATGSGAGVVAALSADPNVARHGLLRLRRLAEDERGTAREWLREAFPSCGGCGFFRELARLAARLDAANALGDDKMRAALEPIVARFEAVFLNRLLALSLRAADPDPFDRAQ